MALLPILNKGKREKGHAKDGMISSFTPINLPINLGWCRTGNHSLIPIFTVDGGDEKATVRWCTCCGAVVVDGEYDGRISPGHYRKLQAPELAQVMAGK